jgi:hypothetical protein
VVSSSADEGGISGMWLREDMELLRLQLEHNRSRGPRHFAAGLSCLFGQLPDHRFGLR